jgi:hypothetical protein
MDRFCKVGLVAIIVLLAMIALHPFISPAAAIAAERYTYLVVWSLPDAVSVQRELDKSAAEGWELAAPVVSERGGVNLIFRKKSD